MSGIERLAPIIAGLLELVGVPRAFADIIGDALPRMIEFVMRHDDPEAARQAFSVMLDSLEAAAIAHGNQKFGGQ